MSNRRLLAAIAAVAVLSASGAAHARAPYVMLDQVIAKEACAQQDLDGRTKSYVAICDGASKSGLGATSGKTGERKGPEMQRKIPQLEDGVSPAVRKQLAKDVMHRREMGGRMQSASTRPSSDASQRLNDVGRSIGNRVGRLGLPPKQKHLLLDTLTTVVD